MQDQDQAVVGVIVQEEVEVNQQQEATQQEVKDVFILSLKQLVMEI